MAAGCCSILLMLTRVLFGVLVCLSVAGGAEARRPHVVLVQLATSSGGKAGHGWLDTDDGWQKSSGTCLASPGAAAVQTALLFGTPPLQQGVVKDLDWRRKPVAATSLADIFRKSGYRTCFYGAWALGAAAPFDPESRGFQRTGYFEAAERDTLTDVWGAEAPDSGIVPNPPESKQPLFAVLAEGRHLDRATILSSLARWLEKNRGPAVVVLLEKKSGEKPGYHRTAAWTCYTRGEIKNKPGVETDWDMHRALRVMAGFDVGQKPDVTIFHKANWPLTDSPDKHRHRGSLVIGHGYALVDGIQLYPAAGLRPDFTRELDIDEHAKDHQRLLKAFGVWWLKTGRALHNPRAFKVGETDRQSTVLTALDWRPSKIIHADGTALLSAPMIYQNNLTGILRGLQSNASYKEKFPAYSGSWAVDIARPGRYKITASLLPLSAAAPEDKELMKLRGGTAHIRLGRNEVRLRLIKGASSVSVKTDADAGITDLECWFTGQLALTRELGAFFVKIERVGDKKFDFKPR